MEHWHGELDVTKMAWAVHLGAHASLAEAVLVHRAQEVIIDAVSHRVTILPVELLFIDVLDGHAGDVFLRQHRERQAVDFVKVYAGILYLVLHLFVLTNIIL